MRALERLAAGIARRKCAAARRLIGRTSATLKTACANDTARRRRSFAERRGGRIELRFTNDDELVRIGELLLGES